MRRTESAIAFGSAIAGFFVGSMLATALTSWIAFAKLHDALGFLGTFVSFGAVFQLIGSPVMVICLLLAGIAVLIFVPARLVGLRATRVDHSPFE